MDKNTLKDLFTALVRPHLEYGNVIWHPRYRKDIESLEKVQRWATRLIPGFQKYSYDERLKRLDIPSLMYRRARGDAIEAYKYLHRLYNVDSSGLLPKAVALGPSTRGHSLKLLKRRVNTTLRQNFFGLRIVNLWNGLPDDVVNAPSMDSFKRRLDKLFGDRKFSTNQELFVMNRRWLFWWSISQKASVAYFAFASKTELMMMMMMIDAKLKITFSSKNSV